MTTLRKTTQISKLKAGSQCAGRGHCPFVALLRRAPVGIPLNSESPSCGLTFHPGGQWALGHGAAAVPVGTVTAQACAAHWLSGTVRDRHGDCGQGLRIRGRLLDWPWQGPVPGLGTITDIARARGQ
jgi:hypothetical protein